jgi:hypothetical protein
MIFAALRNLVIRDVAPGWPKKENGRATLEKHWRDDIMVAIQAVELALLTGRPEKQTLRVVLVEFFKSRQPRG